MKAVFLSLQVLNEVEVGLELSFIDLYSTGVTVLDYGHAELEVLL